MKLSKAFDERAKEVLEFQFFPHFSPSQHHNPIQSNISFKRMTPATVHVVVSAKADFNNIEVFGGIQKIRGGYDNLEKADRVARRIYSSIVKEVDAQNPLSAEESGTLSLSYGGHGEFYASWEAIEEECRDNGSAHSFSVQVIEREVNSSSQEDIDSDISDISEDKDEDGDEDEGKDKNDSDVQFVGMSNNKRQRTD